MRDDWFIRGDVPMTKEEVRAVSIAKLSLTASSHLLDLGAGTGSVSVEAAAVFPGLHVTAFEKNPEAVELIRKNREKAGIPEPNLRIVEGELPGTLGVFLEKIRDGAGVMPTHAFIGGAGGQLEEILRFIFAVNPGIRVVLNAVTVETASHAAEVLGERGIEPEISCIQVSRARKAGRFHLMEGMNPVMVISFGGAAAQRQGGERDVSFS